MAPWRGLAGVQMQPMMASATLGGRDKEDGVLVNEVQPNSPAEAAKVMQGDVITAYNGAAIKSPRDLAMAVANTKAGTNATLTVWRNGHSETLQVGIQTLAPEKIAAAASEDQGFAPMGMSLAPLTPDTRNQLGLNPGIDGVVVAKVALIEAMPRIWRAGRRRTASAPMS